MGLKYFALIIFSLSNSIQKPYIFSKFLQIQIILLQNQHKKNPSLYYKLPDQ